MFSIDSGREILELAVHWFLRLQIVMEMQIVMDVQGRKFKENLAEASAEGAIRSCGWGSGRPPPENFQASGDENQKPRPYDLREA